MDLEEDLPEVSEEPNAAAGPAESFSAFCRSDHPLLVGVLTLLVGDRWVAQDLAQDALIRAWSNWDRVGSLDRPDLWTKHAALNLARSAWRRRQVADPAAGSVPASKALTSQGIATLRKTLAIDQELDGD